jgi:lipase chaperone LimK
MERASSEQPVDAQEQLQQETERLEAVLADAYSADSLVAAFGGYEAALAAATTKDIAGMLDQNRQTLRMSDRARLAASDHGWETAAAGFTAKHETCQFNLETLQAIPAMTPASPANTRSMPMAGAKTP